LIVGTWSGPKLSRLRSPNLMLDFKNSKMGMEALGVTKITLETN